MQIKKLTYLCILMTLSVSLSATPVSHDIDSLIEPLSEKATIGIMISDSTTGDILYQNHAGVYMQPASNMKIITAIAAYSTLAPSSPFQTTMQVVGKQTLDSLEGDIIIQGGGDPTLQDKDIDQLIQSLKDHNIKKIRGNVLIQSNHFDNRIHIPGSVWEEVADCYAGPTSSLTLNNNCFTIKIHQENQKVLLDNPNPFQPIDNRIALENSCPNDFVPSSHHTVFTKNIHIDHNPFSYPQKLLGCLKKTEPAFDLRLSIRNPSEYFSHVLREKLLQAKIIITGRIKHINEHPSYKKVLWQETLTSPPLEDLLEDMLVFSNNRIANHLFKQIGFTYYGDQSSWENSEKAVLQALALHGIVDEDASITDGAGLSRNNRISAQLLHQCLQTTFQSPSLRKIIPLFAQPKQKGTLRYRLRQTKRPIYAKTGYLKGVISLAGYIDPYGPEPKTFAILINGSKYVDKNFEKIENQLFHILEQL